MRSKIVFLSILFLFFVSGCGSLRGVVGAEAEEKAEKPEEVPGFMLFKSPIQPGGGYGLTLNFNNIYDSVADYLADKKDEYARAEKDVEALVAYAWVLVESDPELIEDRSDPTPPEPVRHLTGKRETWKDRYKLKRRAVYERILLELRLDYARWKKTGESLLLPMPFNAGAHIPK